MFTYGWWSAGKEAMENVEHALNSRSHGVPTSVVQEKAVGNSWEWRERYAPESVEGMTREEYEAQRAGVNENFKELFPRGGKGDSPIDNQSAEETFFMESGGNIGGEGRAAVVVENIAPISFAERIKYLPHAVSITIGILAVMWGVTNISLPSQVSVEPLPTEPVSLPTAGKPIAPFSQTFPSSLGQTASDCRDVEFNDPLSPSTATRFRMQGVLCGGNGALLSNESCSRGEGPKVADSLLPLTGARVTTWENPKGASTRVTQRTCIPSKEDIRRALATMTTMGK